MKVQSKGQSKESGLHLGQGLCYVLNNDFTFGFAVEVCLGRSTEREHEQYAFCQSGTSGMILDDGTAVIGTPGVMTWKGTVFAVEVDGEFLSRDKTQYYGPHDNADSPVPNYSYLGELRSGDCADSRETCQNQVSQSCNHFNNAPGVRKWRKHESHIDVLNRER